MRAKRAHAGTVTHQPDLLPVGGIDGAARGRGHARALYDQLFETASRAGHRRVVCEVNSNPPNPGSDAFHAALGFAEVGTATLSGGGKTVRYLSRDLHPVSAAQRPDSP